MVTGSEVAAVAPPPTAWTPIPLALWTDTPGLPSATVALMVPAALMPLALMVPVALMPLALMVPSTLSASAIILSLYDLNDPRLLATRRPGWPHRQRYAAPDTESSSKICDFLRKYR